MKIPIALLLMVVVAYKLPAQYYNYNYSQGYSSTNNVLARQQAETRQRDAHYRNVYSNRSSNTSSYSWRKPDPVYIEKKPKTVKQNYQLTTYDWGENSEELKRQEALRQQQRQEQIALEYRRELERKQERERMAAEMERLRQEKEARLLQERLAYLKMRQPALAADPFQTIYTPPVFKNAKEKYSWYYDQAFNLSGITDRYANLVVSQMALDGEGCVANTIVPRQKNNESVFSSLSLYIGGATMMAVGEKKDYEFILIALKASTDYLDKSQGHIRAYKTLLQLYRANNLLGYAMKKDLGNQADVYAFAAQNGDATALSDLKKLLAANMDSMPNFTFKQFKTITKALPITGADASYGLFVWNKWAQKLQAAGDTACFAAYAKSFEAEGAQPAIIETMQVRLLHLIHNDVRLAKRLTSSQHQTVLKNSQAYVKSFEGFKEKGLRLRADDLGMLFKYYSGKCGMAANPEMTVMVATDKLMDHHDFYDLQQAGLAYRQGSGGWPKSDAKAAELFLLIAREALENTAEEKKAKATLMGTTADFWCADPAMGLKQKRNEINFYLSEAARLDNAYTMEYADWCAEKKSEYFSKEKALKNYQIALKWTEDLHELFIKAEVPDKITGPRIADIQKKMAGL
ncbi:MAG: hypothetical protein V4722_27015 [Bacteroidota bacterium]